MGKTTKTAIAVLSFLVFWMLSGIFFSDTKNNAEISLKINNEESLINVKAKEFSSESRLASVIIQGRTEANRSVLISSETNGIVQSILRYISISSFQTGSNSLWRFISKFY